MSYAGYFFIFVGICTAWLLFWLFFASGIGGEPKFPKRKQRDD